ncbi:hypothetical protein FJT64_003672 [Amphibalanus amphitrite]|uniref:Uncharacterized protein n=1 Tax=Amphibalanus amphitrite TaxID=1232801 RepID=A0A6A4W158_AMPAM|nr:hypothetical protein FJT64_003672 [Amphibalanus amphitrite]
MTPFFAAGGQSLLADGVRDALQAAFALDEYAAYEAFAARRLMPGESADVFLADLRRLAALFGGVPERALACAFVAGLPDSVRQMIRAGCRADGLDLSSVLARARRYTLPEETDATAEADDYDKLKKKLTAYLSPVRNTVAERSAFHQMRMEASEDLEHFLGRLRAQIALCSYPATETDTELRDQCVLGCRAGLQEKLVQLAASKGDKLTLEEVRQAGRAHRDLQQLGAQLAATRAAERPAAVGDQPPYPPESRTPWTRWGGAAGQWPGSGAARRRALRPSPLHLTSFTGHVIPLIGEGQVSVRFRGRDHRLRLVVVDLPGERRLLGRDWMSALNISASGEAAVLTSDRAAWPQICRRSVIGTRRCSMAARGGSKGPRPHLVLKPDAQPVSRPDVKALRSILVSITYYQRLLPNLSTLLAPLYRLLQKGVPWEWSGECRRALTQLMVALRETLRLMVALKKALLRKKALKETRNWWWR